MQGTFYSTIAQDQFGCGFRTDHILAEAARGNTSGLPIFQRRTLPVEVINKDNVDRMLNQTSLTDPEHPTTQAAAPRRRIPLDAAQQR